VEEESITIEWCPVDFSSARGGRMLTWTVESSIPVGSPLRVEEEEEEETSTMTE